MARGPRLDFDWDASNLRHLASHRISHSEFEQAMMNGPVLVDFSDESGEERWYALGATDSLRVLFLVFQLSGRERSADYGLGRQQKTAGSIFPQERGVRQDDGQGEENDHPEVYFGGARCSVARSAQARTGICDGTPHQRRF